MSTGDAAPAPARAARGPTGGSALPTLGLLAVTAAWGSTFFLLKDVLDRLPVTDFLAVRFAVAAAALWLLAPRCLARLDGTSRRRGMVLGLVYGGAQLLQTVGLQTTAASVSGFLTGLYVVLTPLLAALLLRARLGRTVWVAVAVSTAGLAVLSLQGLSISGGAALTLTSAALYALHILGLGAWSRSGDAVGLTLVQLLTITALCLVGALPGGVVLPSTAGDWTALLWMALVAGALALLVQTWAQAHLAPTRAAIIMTMEPAWAAGFAVAFGGERLGLRLLIGGTLVLGAMLLVELGSGRRATAETIGAVPHVGPV